MPNLRFIELLIASVKDQKAFKLPLKASKTIILGPNESGKSSAVKSLYAAFGADPRSTSSEWHASRVTLLMRFSIDNREFSILRHGGYFATFDAEKRRIVTFSRGQGQFAQHLAKMLSVPIRMLSRGGRLVAPPPQYLFMPFYIDQDDGWTSSWNSFAALDTLPQNPKRKILEYYVGMRPENYYQTQAAIDQAKIDMRELRTNRRGIVLTSGALKADFPGPILPVDFSNFEQEIARLTKLVAEQQGEEESRLKALIALHNDLAVVESQLRAIRRVNEELRRDFAFASTTLPESVQCPTCNAVYDNDFASRFEIVDDAQRAIEMISELEGEKARIVEEVAKTRPAHQAARKRYEATRDLLQQTRDSVSLSEIISSRATEIVGQVLNTAIGAMDTRLDELLREKANLEAERRGSIDSRRVRAILDFLNQEFARLAQPLHVAAGPVRSLALPFGGLVSRAVSHGHIPAACLARSTESRIALADLRQTKGLAA